jgi:hypothetical protein
MDVMDAGKIREVVGSGSATLPAERHRFDGTMSVYSVGVREYPNHCQRCPQRLALAGKHCKNA